MKSKQGSSLIGVVMCGINSARTGKDKGLIKTGSSTWVEAVFAKLKSFTQKTYISINSSQLDNYKKIFSEDIVVVDNVSLKGPLAGLFSVHKNMPERDIFILACDMLKIDEDSLDRIIKIYEENNNLYDFFVYKKQLNIEPLAGIYTSRGISKIYNSYFAGSLQRVSMKYILENGNTYAVKMRNKEKLIS